MLASKANLTRLVDSMNVDKPKTVPADLRKLINIVDNDVVKKTVHDKLVTKVIAIDTKIPSTISHKNIV